MLVYRNGAHKKKHTENRRAIQDKPLFSKYLRVVNMMNKPLILKILPLHISIRTISFSQKEQNPEIQKKKGILAV